MTNLSDLIPTGAGTFETVAIDHTYAGSILSGKHYLLDMSGASADKTLTIPSGATKYQVKFTAYNNEAISWRLKVAATSPNKIRVDGVDYDDVKILPSNSGAMFSWNGSKYVVDQPATFVSGTFAGAMTFTGPLTPSAGIVGQTSGSAITAGNIGQYTHQPYVGDLSMTTVDSAYHDFSTNVVTGSLTAGVYVIRIHFNAQMYGYTPGTGPNGLLGYFQLVDSAAAQLDATANILNWEYSGSTVMYTGKGMTATLEGVLNFTGTAKTVKLQGKMVPYGSGGSGGEMHLIHYTLVTHRIA